ncbi:hypothetical protein FHS85_000088 [Rhodoligotrophos appendicifer]|uniref:hypothetical protein n=1 Tax=Rhodoligotrophos appendicifer TaxID=987056 RepID=UPI001FE852F0|nr:hypothetical protein [Rhodoligotrophos appendicifer]
MDTKPPFKLAAFGATHTLRRGAVGYLLASLFCLAALAGWITHIVVCVLTSSWWLLAAGLLIFPVGVIHGWIAWIASF